MMMMSGDFEAYTFAPRSALGPLKIRRASVASIRRGVRSGLGVLMI